MNEVKIYAVPIKDADPSNEEDFKRKAESLGYVWNSIRESNIDLHGLMLKIIAT